MPSWIFNPELSYDSSELVEARRRDKDKFDIEFGAQWPESTMYSFYFDQNFIDRALEEGSKNGLLGPEEGPTRGGEGYYVHVDPALTNNNYGLVGVKKMFYRNSDGVIKPRCILAFTRTWTPTMGHPLNIPEIDAEVMDICKRFRPTVITYDNWNSAGSIAMLKRFNNNVFQTRFDRGHKARIYQNIKDLILESECGLWLYNEPLLISELRNLKYRSIPRGITIGADTRSEVPTDDMADCLAGSCWMATGNFHNQLPRGRFVSGLR